MKVRHIMKIFKVMMLLGVLNSVMSGCSEDVGPSKVAGEDELFTPKKQAKIIRERFEKELGVYFTEMERYIKDFDAFNKIFSEVLKQVKGQRFDDVEIVLSNDLYFTKEYYNISGIRGVSSVFWERYGSKLGDESTVKIAIEQFQTAPPTVTQIVNGLYNARLLMDRQKKATALLKTKLKYPFQEDTDARLLRNTSCELNVYTPDDLNKLYTEKDNPFDSRLAVLQGILSDPLLVKAINGSDIFNGLHFYSRVHAEAKREVAIDSSDDLVIKIDGPDALQRIRPLLLKLAE